MRSWSGPSKVNGLKLAAKVAVLGTHSPPNHNSKTVLSTVHVGGPCGNRTHDTRIKSPVLCLTELTALED